MPGTHTQRQMDRSWIPILKVLLVDLRKLGAQVLIAP